MDPSVRWDDVRGGGKLNVTHDCRSSPLTTDYPLLTTHYSLLTTHYSLLVPRYSFLVPRY